jgi:8-oxo-dGTP pyrophosphatase MutT (NUDIX family)
MGGPKPWTPVETEFLQDCSVFQVSRVLSRSPRNGRTFPFYRIEASDWVNVVPTTETGDLVMIRQYRHGSRALTLEIPGGMVDAGEDPAEAARRELLEETGFEAPDLEPLGAVNPNPALFANRLHVFAAPGARRVAETRNEGNEHTEVELVPRRRLPELLRRGAIDHALVVAALHLWALHGEEAGDVAR